MMEFRYRGFEKNGATVSGSLQAASEKLAYAELKKSGITPLSLESEGNGENDIKWWQRDIALFSKKIPAQQIATSANAIAILLQAGLPLKEALSAAIDTSPKAMKPILAASIQKISHGEKLASAFDAYREKLPDTFLMLVEIGELANNLPGAFTRAAEHFERQAENRKKLIGALIYPAILLIFSVFLLSVLVFFLVPALEPLFTSSGLALPAMLGLLVRTKVFMAQNGVWLLAGFAAVPFVISAINTSSSGQRFLQGVSLRLPYIGKRLVLGDLARFTHALSVMLESGLSFQNAMQAASKTFHLHTLRDLAQTALQETKQGGSFTAHFSKTSLVGKDIKQLFQLADRANQWQKIMGETAKALDAQIEQADKKLTNLITPIITIFIGSTIGILVVSVISAILEINELAFQ